MAPQVNRKQHLKWNELKERKTSNIEEWLKSQKEKVTEIVKEKAEALREKMSAAIADVTADGAFDETKWIPAEDTEVDFDLPAMVGNLMAEIPTLSEMEAAATDMLEAQLESSLEEQGASLISSVMSVVQSGSKKSKAADASKSQQTKKGRKTRAQGSPSQEPDSLVTKMLRDKQEELKQEASAALNEAAADIMEGKLPTSLITPMTEATSIFEEFCTPDWVADLPEPGISLQEITQAAIFDLQEVEEMINTLMDLVGDALDAI